MYIQLLKPLLRAFHLVNTKSYPPSHHDQLRQSLRNCHNRRWSVFPTPPCSRSCIPHVPTSNTTTSPPGISGLILAVALQARSIRCKVYEQAPKFGEIGAGVAFSPNAVRAMKLCSPAIHAGFEKVATMNQSPEKATVWFDFLDGYNDYPVGQEKWLFELHNEDGLNAVHRAHLLDELVKLLEDGTSVFHKRIEGIEKPEGENGRLKMKFHDGSEAMADASKREYSYTRCTWKLRRIYSYWLRWHQIPCEGHIARRRPPLDEPCIYPQIRL